MAAAERLHRSADLTKHPELLLLLRTVRLEAHGWVIVDSWDADLCAVGVASPLHPERLVYLTIWDNR